MSATARAEARRKAILSRGSDRLNKLTTTARGEDAPQFVHDDPPMPVLPQAGTRQFLGEDTIMPTPPAFPPMSEDMPMPDLAAMMNSMGENNPFAAMMMAQQQQQQGAPGQESSTMFPEPVAARKSLIQKLLPLIHMFAMWLLLGYFTWFLEPEVYNAGRPEDLKKLDTTPWHRWADLRFHPSVLVQLVPFFWAFSTCQVALHSLRIFAGFDRVEPPMLLALVMPHLPPPFPAIIRNGLKYMQLGSLFADDVATLIVGLGFLVTLASWYQGYSTVL